MASPVCIMGKNRLIYAKKCLLGIRVDSSIYKNLMFPRVKKQFPIMQKESELPSPSFAHFAWIG